MIASLRLESLCLVCSIVLTICCHCAIDQNLSHPWLLLTIDSQQAWFHNRSPRVARKTRKIKINGSLLLQGGGWEVPAGEIPPGVQRKEWKVKKKKRPVLMPLMLYIIWLLRWLFFFFFNYTEYHARYFLAAICVSDELIIECEN